MRNRIHYLYTGEIFATAEPHVVTTVLGSCVSIFLWDKASKVSGIVHFKSPVHSDPRRPPTGKYGDIAVTEVLRALSELGSGPRRLTAGVYGGGNVVPLVFGDGRSIGQENIDYAIARLGREGIRIRESDVGGQHGRRLTLNTETGEAFVKYINPLANSVLLRSKN